jgi:hypothetical protein
MAKNLKQNKQNSLITDLNSFQNGSGDNLPANKEYTWCKQYIHYRTGKLMIASDYGYKAWPFGGKKKK